jgi:hypothetical protein
MSRYLSNTSISNDDQLECIVVLVKQKQTHSWTIPRVNGLRLLQTWYNIQLTSGNPHSGVERLIHLRIDNMPHFGSHLPVHNAVSIYFSGLSRSVIV